MCIRDRLPIETNASIVLKNIFFDVNKFELKPASQAELDKLCLLYTSDAADERSSVDLGGRRIIKKKKNNKVMGSVSTIKKQYIVESYKVMQ